MPAVRKKKGSLTTQLVGEMEERKAAVKCTVMESQLEIQTSWKCNNRLCDMDNVEYTCYVRSNTYIRASAVELTQWAREIQSGLVTVANPSGDVFTKLAVARER